MWVIFCLDKCSIYWAPTTCGRSLWKLLGKPMTCIWIFTFNPVTVKNSTHMNTHTHIYSCTHSHAHTHTCSPFLLSELRPGWGGRGLPDAWLVSPSSKPHPLPAKHTLYATVKHNRTERGHVFKWRVCGERTTSVGGLRERPMQTWHQWILINEQSCQASGPWAWTFWGRGNDFISGRQMNRNSSLKWVWWAGRRKQTIPHSNSKNLRAENDEMCKEENPNHPAFPKLSVPPKPDATELSLKTRRLTHSFIQQIFQECQSRPWVLGDAVVSTKHG